uniref:Uncharacterized protein n=1 Tax=Triticum urartu TaxID=4572 RepID=A0A8R7UF84_TRIUA
MDWFGLVVPSMNPMHVGLIHLAGLFHAPPPSAFSTPRNHQPPSRRLKSWPNHKTLHHHLKEKKPTTTSLPAAPAMRQLPLRLLRSAAAGSLRSPTLSRGGCPVPLAPHLSAEAAATPAELARWLPRRGYSRFASGFTPLEPKKLGSILDVERAKGLSPEHLVAAWDDPIFCYSFVERKWMYHHVYARMSKSNPDKVPGMTTHRSPFKDITNSSMIENANVTTNSQEAKKNTLYARMSDEKRAAFLEKRRMSRQEKKSQALNIVNGQLTVEAHAPLGSKECTPLRNITNTHTNGMFILCIS